ncbi:interferon alpha-inducible protein 27-like protein 2A [Asterias rubens]|uniref:interferon alpha-inducible protein 27-like protein 2A n=1 Tax=Asterias rubens TaxID=7604 RepID=UPI0014557899|nr:interferon alpha-inducible protein 27-like protein 2A [Asterias rubens]
MVLGYLIDGALAVGGAVVAAPLVGFTAAGIAAGSIASTAMSAAAVAGSGGVASMAAGGVVAACQSVGAAGLTVKSAAGDGGAPLGTAVVEAITLFIGVVMAFLQARMAQGFNPILALVEIQAPPPLEEEP